MTRVGRRGTRARWSRGATEHDEQAVLLAWAAASLGRYPELALLFAVPNGARTSFSVAKRLKAEGLKAGVPDLVLPVARKGWHGLWLEVKRQKGGRLSDAQRWWHCQLREQGQFVVTVAGAERGIEWVERYLGAGTLPAPDGGGSDDVGAAGRCDAGQPEDHRGGATRLRPPRRGDPLVRPEPD